VDTGFIGAKSARMIQRSKSIAARKEKAVEEKSALCKCFNSFDSNGLRLKFFLDAVEDAAINPVTKTAVNGVLVAELFGQG